MGTKKTGLYIVAAFFAATLSLHAEEGANAVVVTQDLINPKGETAHAPFQGTFIGYDTGVSEQGAVAINFPGQGTQTFPVYLNGIQFYVKNKIPPMPSSPSTGSTPNKCTQVGILGSTSDEALTNLGNSTIGKELTSQFSSSAPAPVPATGQSDFRPALPSKPGESSSTIPQTPRTFTPDSKIANIAAIGNDYAQRIYGQELLKTAQLAQAELKNAASDDQVYVSSYYKNLNQSQFQEHINRASDTLSEAIKILDKGKSDLETGDLARFKNLYMNAYDKALAAKEILAEDLSKKPSQGLTLFQDLLSPKDHPLARTPGLKDLFPAADDPKTQATTSEALADRLLMFNGLPQEEQKKILSNSKLKLAEIKSFRLQDGSSKSVAILHNGYLFGGGKSGTDCSSFVSALLPPDVRKANFTTLDFRTMWIYKKRGYFPNPPQYPAQKAKLIRETAEAFIPVNLYEGEILIPGDILVYRLPWDPAGHMFIVKSYNPNNMMAEVMDASQSAGTVRQTTFSVSIDPSDAPNRRPRIGLMGLRLKPTQNRACKFKIAKL